MIKKGREMSPEEIDARERILQAALELLSEETDPEQITTRQIAERARVAVGSINYHFQSKENLFQQAIAQVAGNIADVWQQTLDESIADPVERLKTMLKTNARIAMENAKFARITISYDLLHGNMEVPQVLLPVLREIYGREKSEETVRAAALMLVTAMQLAFIRHTAFRRYAGVDITNPGQRDRWIDLLVDNLIQKQGERG